MTKESVSYRDTYQLMEVNAMLKIVDSQTVTIDSIKIFEKPEINLQNF